MKKIVQNALLLLLYMTVILGIIYPVIIWGAGQLLFRSQANGSLITKDGKITGSSLIAQVFTGKKYFHPRPSAAGSGYDASNSGGSNMAPTNMALIKSVKSNVEALKKENDAPVPLDMATSSGSGLDPHISPEAALWQAPVVAKARGADIKIITGMIMEKTEKPLFGIFGEARVNVLVLNLYLDGKLGKGKK